MFFQTVFASCLSLILFRNAMADEAPAQAPDRAAVADFKTCAKPVWPMESLKQEHVGVVSFRFLIAADGQVSEAVVVKSTGHPLLDQATIDAVKQCRFVAGIKNGKPAPAWMMMQYVWRLD